MKRGRKKKREGAAKKTWLIVLLVVVAVLAAFYAAMAVFFDSHFLFSTKINGIDFSLQSASRAESYMQEQVEGYTLTLICSDGSKEVIEGSAIDIQYTSAHVISGLVKKQKNAFWIESLWKETKLQAEVGISYDETKLSEALAALNCTNAENQTESTSAYPEYQDGTYVIVPEVQGTKLDDEVFQNAVRAAITTSQKTLNLSQAGCYAAPTYTSQSTEVTEACDTMNTYLKAKITYDLSSETVVVDASVIQPWIKLKKEKMEVKLDSDAIKEYIQSLASKYNTAGGSIQFTAADGDVVTVEGGSYGWKISQDDEYDKLVANIKAGEEVKREPEHTGNSRLEANGGIGDTYAEVDLTDQHMYFIKDGKVVLESDVVTGNPNNGNATPQGVYSLSYKTKDAVLKGEKQKDGTYEYETPVSYWMPFNGGIGFHDATWQSSFGGDRYKTHGSHGCVNMPKDKAAELYELISAGTPVVCHY